MSIWLQVVLPSEDGVFTTPGLDDFHFEGPFGDIWLNKPMMQMIIALILAIAFWLWGARKQQVVPTRKQFFYEIMYNYIRDGVGREMLGSAFRPYIGLLVGLFTFILINNWFGEFFLFMFPTFSNIGYSWGMVGLVFVLYVGIGFKTHGLHYLKKTLIPAGVPRPLWILIIPIEIISNFITRPLTLAIRLFAVMFAGHMAIMVFVVGGTYLLTYADNAIYNVAGVFSNILGLALMALELLLGFLQAFIFTILTAQYISSSISDSH